MGNVISIPNVVGRPNITLQIRAPHAKCGFSRELSLSWHYSILIIIIKHAGDDWEEMSKLFYDKAVLDDTAVKQIYKLNVKNWKLSCRVSDMESSVLSTDKLQSLIYNQNCKLPTSVNFDYRTLIDKNDESTLDQYFSKDLVHVIDTITTSRWANSQTESYKHIHVN